MIPRLHDGHYQLKLEIAIICSLLILLLIFNFFPQLKFKAKPSPKENSLILHMSIPPTDQDITKLKSGSDKPKIPEISFEGTLNRENKLPDINFSVSARSFDTITTINIKNESDFVHRDSMQSIPRQIKEVLPIKVNKDITGQIKLSLKIGTDGNVENYILLANTTGNAECLSNVLKAVYQSRWQPAKINGEKTGYWVEKIYNFR